MSQPNLIDSMPATVQTAVFHFWQFAAFHGKENCKKHGVGAFRKFLGPSQGRNVVSMVEVPTARRSKEAAEDWREALAHVCAKCGQCKWARK